MDIRHLLKIKRALGLVKFSCTELRELGAQMGLSNSTLDAIYVQHNADPDRCLLECLTKWLYRADNVDNVGHPSWSVLADALRKIDKLSDEIQSSQFLYILLLCCYINIEALLINALQEGSSITTRWTKLSLSGPPASGKTSILKLLLNEDPPDKHDSTPVATASEVRMTTVVTGLEEHLWEKVGYDTLKKKVAELIKSNIKRTATEVDHESMYMPPVSYAVTTTSSKALEDVEQELTESQQASDHERPTMLVHWIYAVDTGGQAAFLDIAPALLRYTSVNILTHRLHEKLSDETCFMYSVKGKQIGLPIKRKLTNQQVLERSMRSLASLQPPQFEHIKVSSESKEGSDFLVLGTFYDKYKLSNEESLDAKKKILISTLSHFNDAILKYGRSIIFPVNTTARGVDELKKADAIRRKVSKSYIEADVPARWFLFQLELL